MARRPVVGWNCKLSAPQTMLHVSGAEPRVCYATIVNFGASCVMSMPELRVHRWHLLSAVRLS
jgi:hypothetical protein